MIHLFDIEGTITDIDFVHKILFPYARTHLAEYVENNWDKQQFRELLNLHGNQSPGQADLVATLTKYIDEDVKDPLLKAIQGHIWKKAYELGEVQGHVYADVRPFFERLQAHNHEVAIYSSGSVVAQKLLLGNSTAGDLCPLISAYFDTSVGPKKEKSSYQTICEHMGSADIHFYSDVEAELSAAEQAGLTCTLLDRKQSGVASKYRILMDFKNEHFN